MMMNRGLAIDLVKESVESDIKYLEGKINTASYTTYEIKEAITKSVRLKDALEYIEDNLK